MNWRSKCISHRLRQWKIVVGSYCSYYGYMNKLCTTREISATLPTLPNNPFTGGSLSSTWQLIILKQNWKAAFLLTSRLMFIDQSSSIATTLVGFDFSTVPETIIQRWCTNVISSVASSPILSWSRCTSARSSAFLAFNEAAFCPVSTKSSRASEMCSLIPEGRAAPTHYNLGIPSEKYIQLGWSFPIYGKIWKNKTCSK